jgi:hypothetical protein
MKTPQANTSASAYQRIPQQKTARHRAHDRAVSHKNNKLNPSELQDIIRSYTIDRESVASIASRYGRSSVWVLIILNESGIHTSAWCHYQCAYCAKRVSIHRTESVSAADPVFCSDECRYQYRYGTDKHHPDTQIPVTDAWGTHPAPGPSSMAQNEPSSSYY